MKTSNKINIIIIGWARPQLLNVCLESIVRNTTDVDYYVTIVDNSFPHWKDAMKKLCYKPWLTKHRDWIVVDGTDNFVLQARNLGMRARKNAKYHVEIDDDIIVTKQWLSKMVKGLDENPKFGVIVPLLPFTGDLFYSEQIACFPEHIKKYFTAQVDNYKGHIINELWKYHEDNLLPEETVFKEALGVELSCILKRPDMYWDEVLDNGRSARRANEDLVLEMRESGFVPAVCKSVVVYHLSTGTFKWDPRWGEGVEIAKEHFKSKWGEKKEEGIEGVIVAGESVQLEWARKNMLKGAPEV